MRITRIIMIQDRLEKQVKELMTFFENHPGKSQTVTVYEYKCILKGLISLIGISPEGIDYTGVYTYFDVTDAAGKEQLLNAIELKKEACKDPVTIDYRDIVKILTIYKFCLQPENNKVLNSNEWLNLIGDLRVLEMERLGSNVKSK